MTRQARRPTTTQLRALGRVRAASLHLLLPNAPRGPFYAKAHVKSPRPYIGLNLEIPHLVRHRSPATRGRVALLLLLGEAAPVPTTGQIERPFLLTLLPLLPLVVR